MNKEYLKRIWKQEEEVAHIHGWDFSHIHGRYEEENDLPWDFEKIVRQHLKRDLNIMDYDTGGGEFWLSLNHPYSRTAATEGYPPNVELCGETLLPLGINVKPEDGSLVYYGRSHDWRWSDYRNESRCLKRTYYE